MRLSADSHERVERFFREHTGVAGLTLPRFHVHCGVVGRLLMRAAGMSAITFGRRVFVSPALLGRDAEGRVTLPGWLIVHESAHVLQYEQRGHARFLRDYLRGYWRALRECGRWDARARIGAYMAIAEEREAYEAERAYARRCAALVERLRT